MTANAIKPRHDIRAQSLRDLLAAVAEWQRAEGTDRTYWRGIAQRSISEFRRAYLAPEREAFEAAVLRSRHQRRAA